jgi:LAO/AO transport system kinase
MLVCEAAGFDVIIVETVGVGQSETAVADMVDFFLVLMLPGVGDDLQGIKKGILELADMIVVNKADGDNRHKAAQTASAYRQALQILTPASPHWRPPVRTCSALHNEGIHEIWSQIVTHHRQLTAAHALQEKRQQQQLRWMWSMLEDRLLTILRTHPHVIALLPETEQAVLRNQMPPRWLSSAYCVRLAIVIPRQVAPLLTKRCAAHVEGLPLTGHTSGDRRSADRPAQSMAKSLLRAAYREYPS